jgi:hypothetical protein
LTGAGLVVAGAGWTASLTVYNISIQLAVPRWVAGRAVASYRAGASGGLALGSWLWGEAAARVGLEAALIGSSAALLLVLAVGFRKPLPHTTAPNAQSEAPLTEIDLRLPLTGRSGPIVLEFEYRVDPNQARDFYDVMQQVQLSRLRNGGYGWSISRDIEAPELWIERFHCPTWLDYLRQRSRATKAERGLHQCARNFHKGPEPVRIRRLLERPLGSVQWKEGTPDPLDWIEAPMPGHGHAP